MPQYYRLSIQRDCPLDFIRPFLAMTMPEQAQHCPFGLTKPFSHECLLLWRFMYWRYHNSFDEPSLASSDASHFSPVLERIDDRAFSYCDSLDNVSFRQFLKLSGRIFVCSRCLLRVSWTKISLKSFCYLNGMLYFCAHNDNCIL